MVWVGLECLHRDTAVYNLRYRAYNGCEAFVACGDAITWTLIDNFIVPCILAAIL